MNSSNLASQNKKRKKERNKATVANKIAHKNNNVSQMFLWPPEGGSVSGENIGKAACEKHNIQAGIAFGLKHKGKMKYKAKRKQKSKQIFKLCACLR